MSYSNLRDRLARMLELLNAAADLPIGSPERRAALQDLLKVDPGADLMAHARTLGDLAMVEPVARDLADCRQAIVAALACIPVANFDPGATLDAAWRRLAAHLATIQVWADSEATAVGDDSVPDEAYMTHTEISRLFNLKSEDAVRKRLERWRRNHDGDWIENPDPGRQSHCVYRVGAIRHLFERPPASTICPRKKKNTPKTT